MGAGLIVAAALGGCAARALPPGETAGGAQVEADSQTAALRGGETASAAPGDSLAGLPPARTRRDPAEPAESTTETHTGLASWYGSDFHGKPTASGAPYDMTALTAAHQSLPFGTRVRVTNLANGRSVVVTVNDRGPFAEEERLIDLSRAAASALGFVEDGLAEVRVEVLAEAG